jgi:hypothetical protein
MTISDYFDIYIYMYVSVFAVLIIFDSAVMYNDMWSNELVLTVLWYITINTVMIISD